MSSPTKRRVVRRGMGTGASAFILILLLVAWWGVLTLLFSTMFENYIYRVTHPFDSGFNKGPWGFLFLYAILSLPMLRVHPWVMKWVEGGADRTSR